MMCFYPRILQKESKEPRFCQNQYAEYRASATNRLLFALLTCVGYLFW
jgi:hypothetical protein